jgi:hypothetical protein
MVQFPAIWNERIKHQFEILLNAMLYLLRTCRHISNTVLQPRYWESEADSPEVCRLKKQIMLFLREHTEPPSVLVLYSVHCDEWKYIVIGWTFESEIILIPPSLKISESSSNGSYRNTDEVWWRYGISRSCDEWAEVLRERSGLTRGLPIGLRWWCNFMIGNHRNSCRWSLMCLITGNKVKTHTSQGIVKNKRTKPTKEFWEV